MGSIIKHLMLRKSRVGAFKNSEPSAGKETNYNIPSKSLKQEYTTGIGLSPVSEL